MPLQKQESWQTDPSGRLRLAGIHDGTLAEFSYVYKKMVEFVIRGASGELTRVSLEKPLVLHISELWEGSIVDDIHIWRAGDVPSVASSNEETGWNALLSTRVASAGRKAEAERLTRAYPQADLLVVSCSYGGAWSVLCERVHLKTELKAT